MALGWAVVQLMAVVGAPILSELTGRPALAGLAPALFVAWWAVATLAAGRYMDARGRASGIRLGFVVAAVGSVLVYLGTDRSALPLYLLGMALPGGGLGAVNLARAGGADMYPPEHRAHGISLVLVGAAFGAILGPVAFLPLLGGPSHDLHTLAAPWIVAAAVMAGGALLTMAIRVDPLDIGRSNDDHAGHHHRSSEPTRPLRALLSEPVVRVALVAAVIAQTVMTSMMGIVSLVLHDHGHGWKPSPSR
jgi:MFS family permease